MWGEKKRRIAELQDRVAELTEQRDEARKELADSRAAVIRLSGRNTALAERLERAHEAANDGALDEMGARLDRALRACARYRVEAAEDHAAIMAAHQQMKQALDSADRARAAGRSGIVRELDLSERARRSLAEQLATVQAANDAMCREAVDRAGTLAPTATPTVPKPSEVAW